MITRLRYRLDLTGESLENREEYQIKIGEGRNRTFALPGGAFYTKNFILIDKNRPQTPLVRGVDYQLLYLYDEVSKMAKGKEIVGLVTVFNPEVGTELIAKANLVGANFVNHYELLTRIIEDLELDNREVDFWRIEGTPKEWLAAPHLQDIGDIFGFEYHVSMLAEIVSVISSGATPELETVIKSLTGIETRLTNLFNAHIESEGNVHKVSANQTGTYNTEEIDGFLNEVKKSIGGLADAVGSNKKDIDGLNEKLDSLNNHLEEHIKVLGQIRGDFGAIEAFFGRINKELARLRSVDDRQQREINELNDLLRSELNTVNGNIDDARREFNLKLNTVAEELRRELDSGGGETMSAINSLSGELTNFKDANNNRLTKIDTFLSTSVTSDVASAGTSKVPVMWSAEMVKLASLSNLPITATRWPTKAEVGLNNVPNVDTTNANNINSGVFDRQRIPVAPSSANANQGFGGFRYTFVNGILTFYID